MNKNKLLNQKTAFRWRPAALTALVVGPVLTGCSTGNLGSFSETTFFDSSRAKNVRELGPVQGESCQTMVLYVFPKDTPASTQEAMQKALSAQDGAVFLANVSVERRQYWHVGYSEVCTLVTGTAYAAERVAE